MSDYEAACRLTIGWFDNLALRSRPADISQTWKSFSFKVLTKNFLNSICRPRNVCSLYFYFVLFSTISFNFGNHISFPFFSPRWTCHLTSNVCCLSLPILLQSTARYLHCPSGSRIRKSLAEFLTIGLFWIQEGKEIVKSFHRNRISYLWWKRVKISWDTVKLTFTNMLDKLR